MTQTYEYRIIMENREGENKEYLYGGDNSEDDISISRDDSNNGNTKIK